MSISEAAIITQELKKRKAQKIETLFTPALAAAQALIALSPNDTGVMRNAGRRGSCYGPEAIIHCFSQMAKTHFSKHIAKVQVCCVNNDSHFTDLQQNSFLAWQENLQSAVSKIVHLGGGHDHIYPLLKALGEKYKKIKVLNFDAHLDTRVDPWAHSGTPFRQFAREFSGQFHLIQIGIHDFANPLENFFPLENQGIMDIISRGEIDDSPQFDQKLKSLFACQADEILVLSIDSDVFDVTSFEAVSAVNSHGLSLSLLRKSIDHYLQIPSDRKVLGIYEYNPLYDNLSQKGARALASLLYQFLK